jgi:tRNA 2-selenouridine synthase
MSFIVDRLDSYFAHEFDTIIDVRSPSEFAEDRIPGAINLPVLDDVERARVGTIYKQESPFLARKLGAAMVFRNSAAHVENTLAHHDGGWRPLVYCWRGGQRSGSFAWMLREIGWRAELVEGGYRAYRRLVTAYLYDQPLKHRFIQLGGYTGTAKTALLPLLSARGVQTLDLEGLARHRGSLLGELPGGQPAQKGFETELVCALHALDPDLPVLVEAESSKIGQINLPPTLWEAMKAAPWIEVNAPIEARARYLAEAYKDILADGKSLRTKLDPLRVHRGHALVDFWGDLIARDDKLALCRSLAEDHYDRAYRASMRAQAPRVLHREDAGSLDLSALEALADRLAERIQRMSI